MKKVILSIFILLIGLASFSQQVPFVTKDGVVINIYKYDSAGIATALLSKQNALSGTGFVKIIGTTISYDNNSYSTTIHGHALGSLSGVSLVSLAANDMFVYSGTLWENKTISAVKTLWGITTVGNNMMTVANPSAVRYVRINADNTVSLLDASTFLAAIGGIGSYTETDPIVKAINGIVKSNGTTISAAVSGTDYVLPSATFFIGTTSIAHNRASASMALTGITSIDGSAVTLATGRTIGMTGDVVWTSASFNGSGNVTGTSTIQAAAVTYAKIQNVAANSFLANATGSAATVQEIATTRIPLFSSAITGTPSSTTYLRGDGTWSTLAGGGGITVGSTSITGGATGKVLYDNAGVVGEIDANFTNYTSLANKDLLWYNSATSEWNNITVATLKGEIAVFTTSVTGLVPAASGGNTTTEFLRKDGTWQVPAGGGGGLTFQQELGYSAMRLF